MTLSTAAFCFIVLCLFDEIACILECWFGFSCLYSICFNNRKTRLLYKPNSFGPKLDISKISDVDGKFSFFSISLFCVVLLELFLTNHGSHSKFKLALDQTQIEFKFFAKTLSNLLYNSFLFAVHFLVILFLRFSSPIFVVNV